jgi:hypothetical protein
MNLLEHYIIEVQVVKELQAPSYLKDTYLEVEVLCDCWGNKRVYKHVTTKANWERAMRQGYFLA